MSGSSSSGAGPSCSHMLPDYSDPCFWDPDSPATTPGTPPPFDYEWEQVGAKKKAKRQQQQREREQSTGQATVTASPAPPAKNGAAAANSNGNGNGLHHHSTANGKKPMGRESPPPSSSSKAKTPMTSSSKAPIGGGSASNGKAAVVPAPPPSLPAPPPQQPKVGGGAVEKGTPADKKGAKRPKELSKAELQQKCEALLTSGSPSGHMPIGAFDELLAASVGVPSWSHKYKAAHGPLKTFLSRCPHLLVVTVEGVERVYLQKALDDVAREALAAAKASSPKKRGRGGGQAAFRGGGKSGCTRWALRLLKLAPRVVVAFALLRFSACGGGLPAAVEAPLAPLLRCELDPSSVACDEQAGADRQLCTLLASGGTTELRELCLHAWLPPLVLARDLLANQLPALERPLMTYLPGCSPPTHDLLRLTGCTS